MTDAPIGIFDSGFGGLSVYRSIRALLPYEPTIYIGDHQYLPYGGKTKAQIRARAKKLITFLLSKKAKLIVVACNTATIAGIETYRTWFPDIPVIGVVPVVKTAANISRKKSFAVLSTVFTAESAYQKKLIEEFAPDSRVYNLGCPNLVRYVELGLLHGPEINTELRTILTAEILSNIDALALGCTHYPFLQDAIRAIVGDKIQILDSGGAVARHVSRILTHNGILARQKNNLHYFYSTQDNRNLSGIATKLLGARTDVYYERI